MSILELMETRIKSVIKLNAIAAIAPLLVTAGGIYMYSEFKESVSSLKEQSTLVLISLEKQSASGKLLKVVSDKMDAICDAKKQSRIPAEVKVNVCNTLTMMCSAKNIPMYIACGLIDVESQWDTKAISSCGAKGLLQVMPATAKPYLRVERKSDNSNELYDPTTAIIVGLSYLADLQSQYVELGVTESNNYTFALHSFFWGGSNSAALLGKKDTRVNVPNFSYPIRVIAAAKQYKDLGL